MSKLKTQVTVRPVQVYLPPGPSIFLFFQGTKLWISWGDRGHGTKFRHLKPGCLDLDKFVYKPNIFKTKHEVHNYLRLFLFLP